MLTKVVRWFVGNSQVERLLLAATIVAALRLMLIHAVFIGFDLDAWGWFKAVEVMSGLAFAVLEGKALAYVSRLWVSLRPERWEQWLYWGVLAVGQFLLLTSIVGVTAYAAASVRRETGIDALLGNDRAVVWSMFVTALNPLVVILIGMARAIDPAEQADLSGVQGKVWPPLEKQIDLLLHEYEGPTLDPARLVAEFERVSGHRISLAQAEVALVGGGGIFRQVQDDEPVELTIEARRAEVARLLDRGVSQAAIARRLDVSYTTIKRDVAALQNGR